MKVDILSPEKLIPTLEASAVSIPTVLGYMGILPGHTAYITELDSGGVIVNSTEGQQRYFISGGYLQIEDDQIKIIADGVEPAGDIDFSRAEEALKRAQGRLSSFQADTDIDRASKSKKRAEERIKLK